jgi:ATP phosphoribosyltransferase
MPESRSRRLKQLEQRVEQVAPGKRDVFYMNVSRDRYDEAMAVLKDLHVGTADSTDPVEAVEVQLEPEKVTETPRKAQTEEPDESSDRARLKHLRDVSNARDRRDWHGQNW